MSGSRPTPAEQHLGDTLSALVDGELGHETRDRVLAHLVTCPKCKAEADAQRRLKSVFAQAAPPPPPAGLLARLQGLPGAGSLGGPGAPGGLGGPGVPGGLGRPVASGGLGGRGGLEEDDGDASSVNGGPGTAGSVLGRSPLGGGPLLGAPDSAGSSRLTGGMLGGGAFRVRGEGPFGLLPDATHGGLPAGSGFRVHPVGRADAARRTDTSRQEAERSASRGRRFAVVAAGAVSLAAVALGGLTPGTSGGADPRGAGSGSNATPMRSGAGTGAGLTASSSDTQRRRQASGAQAASDAQGWQSAGGAVVSGGTSAPLLSGTQPMTAGTTPVIPLTAPFTSPPPPAMTSWPTGTDGHGQVPGPLSTPQDGGIPTVSAEGVPARSAEGTATQSTAPTSASSASSVTSTTSP